MLHEKSVKCSSKINDFTSQRVRGSEIQLRGALLAACIRVSLYVCALFSIHTSNLYCFNCNSIANALCKYIVLC